MRKHSLGEDHLGIVENLNNLAALYLAQGQLQQAETLLLQALALYQKVQKPEDLLLDPVLNSLAQIEKERQNLAKALMYLERLRAIRQLVLGQTNPRTLEVAQEITELARVQALSAEKM